MYRHNVPRTPEVVRGYLLGNTLGAGSFGAVRKCTHLATGKECCVKVLPKHKNLKEEVMGEIEILAALEGGSGLWTRMLDVEQEHDENWYIFLELADGGDLFALYECQSLRTPFRTKELLYDIAKALQELHERSIVHRDIKPDNILLSTRTPAARALLADFGVSTWCDGAQVLDGRCGTARYMAPEICADRKYGSQVDMWSFGLIAYILVFGKPLLPEGATDDESMQLNAALKPGFLKNTEGHSAEAFGFIKSLLRINPAKRLTAHAAVNHPYLRAARLKREREAMLFKYSSAGLEAKFKEEKEMKKLRERLNRLHVAEQVNQRILLSTQAPTVPEDTEAAAQRGWNGSGVEIKQEEEDDEDVWVSVARESVRERGRPVKRRLAIPRPRRAAAANSEAGPSNIASAAGPSNIGTEAGPSNTNTAIPSAPAPQNRRMVYLVAPSAPRTPAAATNTNININTNNNGPLINLSSTPSSATPAPRVRSGIPRFTSIPRFTGNREQGDESPNSSPPVDGDLDDRYEDVFMHNFRIEQNYYRCPPGVEMKDWYKFMVPGPRL